MRVLITGAGGFIGGHFVEDLSNDYEIMGLDIKFLDKWKIDRTKILESTKFKVCDISDRFRFRDALHEFMPDVIMHLAGIPIPKQYLHEPLKVIRSVLYSGIAVVEETLTFKAIRSDWNPFIIFTSSSEVYGNGIEYKEDTSPRNYGNFSSRRWCYALSKALTEELLMASSLDWIILRIFNVVGLRIDEWGKGRVLTRMISDAFIKGEISVTGDGDQTRAFTHIDDLKKAIHEILEIPKAKFNRKIYNFGNPRNEVSMSELAGMIQSAMKRRTGREVLITKVPADIFFGRHYDEIIRRVPSMEKWDRTFGYFPHIPLNYIIDELVDDAKKYFWSKTDEE